VAGFFIDLFHVFYIYLCIILGATEIYTKYIHNMGANTFNHRNEMNN
jgi:hypothetical protein